MPEQFVVPQFIEAEDTIIGPVTARQFVIMMVTIMTDAALYKLIRFVPFLIIGIPLLVFGSILAFFRVNGMPFHFFLINIIQTFRKPRLRVWDKRLTDRQLRELTHVEIEAAVVPMAQKAPLTTSRLKELTLVVNTGGVYRPDDERSPYDS